MAKLVIKTGRNTGMEFKLTHDSMIMGRRSVCPIPISDSKASREHAVVLRKGDDYFLQDLSRNGTLLNGLPASKAIGGSPLKYGDLITIGETVLEMVDEKAERITIEIPGYNILEKIGSGGMGIIYKAKQLSMDRIVALKILNDRYSVNTEFVDRFIREARAAGKLNHPNVIHVHDISKSNGRHYFSMEYIDGSSIKEVLRAEKRIDIKRALDIILQTSKALEFAHENRIVHRDIKPDNIMLTKEGIVKIADLGIAKTFEETAPSNKELRRVMGTPHYMAPEQALGKVIDHRVDIYSLGATFYHMVTGNTPFTGNTAHEILKAHIQESLPPIQELNPSVPDPVCFIIERMMAKLPEKRYPDMSRVIEDIERLQIGVEAGIKRIEEGESTIMRGFDGSQGPQLIKNAQGGNEEIATGTQTPVSRVALVLTLTVVFAVTVTAVVTLLKTPQPVVTSVVVPTPEQPLPGPKPIPLPTPPVNRSNAEAAKLLQGANDAKIINDFKSCESKLKEIQERYPASTEAEKVPGLLRELGNERAAAELKVAQALFDGAKKFDENNVNLEECIKKYNEILAALQKVPKLQEPVKQRIFDLQNFLNTENENIINAALKDTMDLVGALELKRDYDAVRIALNSFPFPKSPQQKIVQGELIRVNTVALASLNEAQNAADGAVEKHDFARALTELQQYSDNVRDAMTVNAIETARQEIDNKAAKYVDDELAKSSEKAKNFEYKDALIIIHAAIKNLGDMKQASKARDKNDLLQKQQALHEKIAKTIKTRLAEIKCIPLPFLKHPKKNPEEGNNWALSTIEMASNTLLLEARGTGASGIPRRLADLTPIEQYEFYKEFLPEPTTDDNKALAAFCRERGLEQEARLHE